MDKGVLNLGKYQYQWEKFITDNEPTKDINNWDSKFGATVISRNKDKTADEVQIRVLVDNPDAKVFLIGEFNDWGKDNLDNYELQHDENSVFCEITTKELKHKDPYKLLVLRKNYRDYMQDPAGYYFDDDGNTIFWDYDDPKAYQPKNNFIDTVNRSTKIIQTDLPGLISHWKSRDGKLGKDIKQSEYYKFIAESGIIEHIKKLGFNSIQFLPFAQSIDGDNWKYRYLVPFQFAIQKNWGTPDEFAKMVDEFHKHDIAVIGDFVIGHLPHKDYNIFGRDGMENGIHNWINRHKTQVFMKEETPWGTMRVDFDNQYVRRFIISSALHFMKRYRIDGFRIDNVDGIIRYGPNGDGDERPNGRKFLKELNKTIYEYNPFALIHFESHYFHGDNAKMLVIPFEDNKKALGATCYNSSRITYYFHTEYMLKSVDKVSPWKFRDITEEKEWGQSNSTIADFHNHDAAAGLIEMRCTGSYAYDAMTVKQPHNHVHAVGKIKVMEAIISFGCEGRTLDLIQTFLLQTGTFEHDSSIQWYKTFTPISNAMVDYKKRVNEIMDDPAFWPLNTKHRKYLNVDDKNKILVIERKSKESKYVIVINLSSWTHHNYKVGVSSKRDFAVELNSDLFDYGGYGMISYPETLKNNPSNSFELLDREVELSIVPPYGVVVLKEEGK